MDGVFIIDKPKGCTSHDVVAKMRKLLATKKVGHSGTLDPMATGVLPILVGKGTKIAKYLIEHDKIYEACISLGEKTDTADGEGTCIEKKEVNIEYLTEEHIKKVLAEMKGKQKQVPPMYSAIKINGKKLYEYAREGIEVQPEARTIEIYDISFIGINIEARTIQFRVKCSKGTYIRVLCEQIAEKLGTVGYMKELRRVQVENFELEQALSLEEIGTHKEDKEFLEKHILSIEEIFEGKDAIILDKENLSPFLNGVLLRKNLADDVYRVYNSDGQFIGLGVVKKNLLKRDIIIEN